MQYEDRIALIVRNLNGFLRQFRMPEHLDDASGLERVRMTAEAINKRMPAGIARDDLADRMSDAFVSVLEKHRGREWPNVEQFVSALSSKRAAESLTGDAHSLSAEQRHILESRVLPTARRWLGIPGLADEGRRVLEHWGQDVNGRK